MQTERRGWRPAGVALVLAAGLDQLTKVFARTVLAAKPITVIPGYFDLVHERNTGAAFSVLRDHPASRWALSAGAVIALVVVFRALRRAAPGSVAGPVALGLIAGGAIGNLIDRLRLGHVTDFVLWHVHQHHWPVFNVADVALVVGVGLLLLEQVRGRARAGALEDARAP